MHSAPNGVRKSTGHEVSAGAKRNRAGSDSFSLTGDSEERLFLAIGRAHANSGSAPLSDLGESPLLPLIGQGRVGARRPSVRRGRTGPLDAASGVRP